jgi:hypothetical protein
MMRATLPLAKCNIITLAWRTMGRVHCHRRSGALLALAALALQMVLAFGHVHADGIRAPHGVAAGIHKTAAAQPQDQTPAQNSGDADDYCAICASIYLVANSVTEAPPQLPVPAGFERVTHSFAAARGIIEPPRVAFRSRAPPATA